MNILFLSLIDFDTFEDRNIYSDLLREFIKAGHSVYCISPVERKKKQKTKLLSFGTSRILKLKIGNTQKVSFVEKGISILLIEYLYIRGIKKYFSNIVFDLVLYVTPPVTFAKVIKFVKNRDAARSYLMLKDIFPQNSIDLGILSKHGIKGLIYRFFKCKEKQLYELSDCIGCTSQANINYILKHNESISPSKVEFCANSIDPLGLNISELEKKEIRIKYGLPLDKKIFIYGGNLGAPQDVKFIISCLQACEIIENAFFVIAGSGTDRHYLEEYIEINKPNNVKLLGQLPKTEYDKMIACCDIGLIFLSYKFTVPNTPSRLLSYCQAHLPTIACVDNATDIGDICENNQFGWQCKSNDSQGFADVVKKALQCDYIAMGDQAYKYMVETYSSKRAYETIINFMNKMK